MRYIGDVTNIDGAKIEPVDCITFGAPCQDLSVAGKRAGMKHEAMGDDETTRSGLFYEAVRIIKEMREEDERNGRTDEFIRPRYALYENVPGALSSGKDENGKPLKGEDFRCVLEALAQVIQEDAHIPRFEGGGGHTQAASSWTTDRLLGGYTMLNISEYRKDEKDLLSYATSTDLRQNGFCLTLNLSEQPREPNPTMLSDILEEETDPKYELSAKACKGILTRADRRGKALPPVLREALEKQIRDRDGTE